MYKLFRLFSFCFILLLTAHNSNADTAQVYVDGSYAFGNNGYGIGPYGGTLNGHSASFFCVDFSHDIQGQTGWLASVTPLGSVGTTLLQNPTTYSEMAWLASQMINPTPMAKLTGQSNLQNVEAELQWTIWALSGLGSTTNPYPGWTSFFYQQAAANYSSVSGAWEILTPESGTGYPNRPGYYGQEFLVLPAPEPSSIMLLLAGLAVFAILALRK